MEKQLRKVKDRCFLCALVVFFLECWVIITLHGYLSGLGFETRSTQMLLIDSMLYFLLFFAVVSVKPVSSYFFSLYSKKLQKQPEATNLPPTAANAIQAKMAQAARLQSHACRMNPAHGRCCVESGTRSHAARRAKTPCPGIVV